MKINADFISKVQKLYINLIRTSQFHMWNMRKRLKYSNG